MNAPFLMTGIGGLFERGHAEAAIGVEEAFAVLTFCEIDVDDALDRIRDLMLAERRAENVADAGVFRAGAAELELVELDAFLVDAEHADMAGVVMPAGVDAAGNLDLQLADVVLALEVLEALGDVLRDGDRARVGEIAIVEARAADDVGDEPGVR